MNVHGLLSWFDEDPDMLYDAVVSHADHCDTVVALDGRYAIFPAQRDESSGEEYDAIMDACRDTGTPCTVVAPDGPWDGPHGGEVAKRAHLFTLAERQSAPDDWYWIFDADFQVTSVHGPWREKLQSTGKLAALVTLTDRRRSVPHPVLFRALRGLTVTEHHWHYHVPDGPVLWDYEQLAVEREDMTAEFIAVAHRDDERAQRRTAQRKRYYHTRDKRRVERDFDTRRRQEIRRRQREDARRMDALLSDVLTSVGAIAA